MEIAEVWPENWSAWALFDEMGGQWRTRGMGGMPYALDYGPLLMRMERLRLSDIEYENLFADVRVLEHAALKQMKESEAHE